MWYQHEKDINIAEETYVENIKLEILSASKMWLSSGAKSAPMMMVIVLAKNSLKNLKSEKISLLVIFPQTFSNHSNTFVCIAFQVTDLLPMT